MIYFQPILQMGAQTNDNLWEGLNRTLFPFIQGDGNWLIPTIFILIIVATFFYFIGYTIWKSYRAKNNIAAVKEIFSAISTEKIHDEYEELRSQIIESEIFKATWREFEKSIIKIEEGGRQKIYSTASAENFFNEHSLIRDQLNVRLLNSASGILVTLGLIGTFIGISAGLGEIQFSGSDSNELRDGITTLLSGAQIAFSSSVWGLILSLFFNFYEKYSIQSLSSKVTDLQVEVDRLFEKKSSEEILAQTLNEEKQQTIELQTFNDKLVMRLGEVLDNSIQENFNPLIELLLESVEELNEFKKESATDAIQNMIAEFKSSMTDGANSQIEELSSTLQETAGLLNQANEKTSKDQEKMRELLTNHVDDFENKMQSILNDVMDNQQELNNQQRESLNEVTQSLQNGVESTDEHFKSLLESTGNSVNSNLKEIKDMFSSLSEDYEINLKDLKEHFTAEKETMGAMVEKINGQLQAFDKSITAMNESSSQMGDVIPLLERTTNNLKETTHKFKESQSDFLDEVSDYVKQSENINSGNKDLIEEIKDALEHTRSHWRAYEDRFNGIKEDLNGVFDKLGTGLRTYQDETKSGLTKNLQEFDQIMGKSIGRLSTGIDELKEILESLEEYSN